MKLSAMASLLLGHGGWPLQESEAVGIVERFFTGKCGSEHSKQRLMRRLGVVAPKFTVEMAREHAMLYARAALAELQSEDLITSKESVGFARFNEENPRWMTYSKTDKGRRVLAELATRGRLANLLWAEGWP